MTNKRKIIGSLLSITLLVFICSLTIKFFNNKKYKDILKENIITEELKPAFNNNNIAVAFASDNNYAKYLSVAIVSLTDNMSKDYNYDIVILEDNIKDKSKKLLLKQIKDFKNVSLRFIDINKYFDVYNNINFVVNGHFTRSVYNRLFIPEIFKNYNKVIYLDVDILIKCDLVELYNTDLGNNLIGAVGHFEYEPDIVSLDFIKELNKKFSNILGIDNYSIHDYINSGVILYDINHCNEYDFLEKCLNLIKTRKNHTDPDQSVINKVSFGKIHYLDYGYNLLPFHTDKIKAKIIHFYCNPYKPWDPRNKNNDNIQYVYWRITSIKSPFCHSIVRLTKLLQLKINLMRYKLCYKIYSSERKLNKYKNKIENTKNLIKLIEKI